MESRILNAVGTVEWVLMEQGIQDRARDSVIFRGSDLKISTLLPITKAIHSFSRNVGGAHNRSSYSQGFSTMPLFTVVCCCGNEFSERRLSLF